MEGKDGGAAKVLRREWALRRLPRWGRGVRRRAAPLRTEMPLQDIPVLRSAYFTQRVHSTLCSKTLDLQVRFAHPTGVFAPQHPFRMFRCCAWLILRFRTIVHADAGVPLGLFDKSKRSSSSRFAASIKPHRGLISKTLMLQVRCAHPTPSHRNAPSGHSGVPVGLFYAKSTQYSLLQNARPSGSLRSPYG